MSGHKGVRTWSVISYYCIHALQDETVTSDRVPSQEGNYTRSRKKNYIHRFLTSSIILRYGLYILRYTPNTQLPTQEGIQFQRPIKFSGLPRYDVNHLTHLRRSQNYNKGSMKRHNLQQRSLKLTDYTQRLQPEPITADPLRQSLFV